MLADGRLVAAVVEGVIDQLERGARDPAPSSPVPPSMAPSSPVECPIGAETIVPPSPHTILPLLRGPRGHYGAIERAGHFALQLGELRIGACGQCAEHDIGA